MIMTLSTRNKLGLVDGFILKPPKTSLNLLQAWTSVISLDNSWLINVVFNVTLQSDLDITIRL